MKRYSVGPSLVAVAVLASVSACSTIKNLFPDKEKDYQYTVEIPPLNVPADLSKNDSLGSRAAASSPLTEEPANSAAGEAPVTNEPPVAGDTAKAVTSEVPIANEPPVVAEPATTTSEAPVANEPPVVVEPSTPAVSETPAANEAPAAEKPAKDATAAGSTSAEATASDSAAQPEAVKIELAKSDNGASQLRIGAPLAKAWRIVGKALSRKSIEVTERNQEESRFTVQYDPDEKKVEDGSLWDEAVFMFSGFGGNEKAYVLKLTENNGQSAVVLLDEAGQPLLNDAAGLKLLTLLQDTIKADVADN